MKLTKPHPSFKPHPWSKGEYWRCPKCGGIVIRDVENSYVGFNTYSHVSTSYRCVVCGVYYETPPSPPLEKGMAERELRILSLKREEAYQQQQRKKSERDKHQAFLYIWEKIWLPILVNGVTLRCPSCGRGIIRAERDKNDRDKIIYKCDSCPLGGEEWIWNIDSEFSVEEIVDVYDLNPQEVENLIKTVKQLYAFERCRKL